MTRARTDAAGADKDTWRRWGKERRERLRAEDRAERDAAIVSLALGLLDQVQPARGAPRNIVVPVSHGSEPNLHELARALRAQGDRVLRPRYREPDKVFDVVVSSEDDERRFEAGPHGIRQPMASLPATPPKGVHAILVPGLAFDDRGHRVGYGRGMFDRFLVEPATAVRIGYGYRVQFTPEPLPMETHDEVLDWFVDENDVHGPYR